MTVHLGSRLSNAARNAYLAAMDTDYTLVSGDAGLFILASSVEDAGSEFRTGQSHSLQWRVLPSGSFATLALTNATGPHLDNATGTITNGTDVSTRRAFLADAPSGNSDGFVASGKEFTSSTSQNYGAEVKDAQTEAQWAIDMGSCTASTGYEFQSSWGSKNDGTAAFTLMTVTTAAASGGTAHTFTETDSSTTSDTLSATKGSSETSTDTSTASDTLSAVKATASTPHTFTKTDSSTASDTLTATKASSLSATDSATSSDVLVATQASAKAFTETDTATAADTLIAVKSVSISITDSATASDVYTGTKANVLTKTDSSSAADTLAATKAVTETNTDTATSSDTLVATRIGARAFTETDSSSASDTLTATKSVALSVTDSASTSDTLATQKDSTLSVTDGAASSDTLVADRTITLTTTDGSSASDTLSVIKSSTEPTVEVVASVSMTAVGSVDQSNVQTLTFTPSVSLAPGDQLVLIISGVGSAMQYILPALGIADATYDYSVSTTDPGFTEFMLWPPESGAGAVALKPTDFNIAIPSGGATANIIQNTMSWIGVRTVTSSEPTSYDFTATLQRDCSSLDASAAGNILGGVLLRISNVVPAFSGPTKNWDLVATDYKALAATTTTAGSIGGAGSTNVWGNPNNLAVVFAGSNRLFTTYTGTGSSHGVYFYNGITANGAPPSTELYDDTLQGTTTTDADHRSYAGSHVSYYLPKNYTDQRQQTNINVNPVSGTDEVNRKFLVTLLDIPSSLSASFPHDESTASDTLLAVKNADGAFTKTDIGSSSDTLLVTKAAVLTKTDAATASDTLLAVRSGAKVFTETDSATAEDTLLARKSVTLAITDSSTAADVLDAEKSGAKVFTKTDSSTTSDTLLATKSVALTFTDSSSSSDTLAATGSIPFTKTDSSSALDTLSATKSVTLTVTDSVAASDTLSATKSGNQVFTKTDSSSSSDTLAVTKSATQVSTDSSTASDDLSAISSGVEVFTETDSSTVTDTLIVTVDRTLSLTDSADTSDTLTASKGLLLNITDSSSTSDTLTGIKGYHLAFTDTSTTDDQLDRLLAALLSITDSSSVADTLTATGPTTLEAVVTIPGLGGLSFSLLTESEALAVIDIWNTALTSLGVSTITSVTDGTPQQKLISNVYPLFKQQFLADHVWNGAKKTAILSSLTDNAGAVVAPVSRWSYAYTLPTDSLRIWRLNGLENQPNYVGGLAINLWEIECVVTDDGTVNEDTRRCLCTDQGSAKIEYVFDVPDSKTDSLLGPLVKHAMGRTLAVYVAQNFGKNSTEIAQLEALAKDALLAAKGVDGQEGTPQIMSTTSLLGVRYL